MKKYKDLKKKYQQLSLFVIMLMLILSRVLGERGQMFLDFIEIIALIMLCFIILCLFIKGYVFAVLWFLAMGIPLGVAFWGMYIDNLIVVLYAMASFFLVCLVTIILSKKYME